MKYTTRIFVAFLLAFFLSSPWAAEISVPPGVGTLAAAVAAASPGDTLILEGGIESYSGSVTVNKSLTIRPVNRATNAVVSSEMTIQGSGIEVTVQGLKFSADIDVNQAAAVRIIENEWQSGNIDCADYKTSQGDGSLVIVGNRLLNGSINNIFSDGAYIAGNEVYAGSANFSGRISAYAYVWIVGNKFITSGNYPGIVIEDSAGIAHILANRVRCNGYSSYCIQSDAPSTFIVGNVVEVNDNNITFTTGQFGIYASSGDARVINNVIRGMPLNATRSSGAAIYITAPSSRVSGNIIIDYVTDSNTPISVTSSSAEVTHNLCFSNSGVCPAGDGNLNADPLFVDLNDYQLAAGSPAINAGPPDLGMADLDRTRNDMGAQGGPWSFAQYDAQRDEGNLAPYVYPLFNIDSILSGGILEIQALGVARLR